VLAPVSVLAVWTANQVSDTSRYVAKVTPLIHDPAIQHPLTDKITNEIVTKINVEGLTDQAAADLSQKGFTRIGSLLQGVSGSLASGVQGCAHSRVHKIITGPRMADAWVQVNRAASQQLNAVLAGCGGKQRRPRRRQRPGHPGHRAPGGRRRAGPGSRPGTGPTAPHLRPRKP